MPVMMTSSGGVGTACAGFFFRGELFRLVDAVGFRGVMQRILAPRTGADECMGENWALPAAVIFDELIWRVKPCFDLSKPRSER
jgi:hypothetical protein